VQLLGDAPGDRLVVGNASDQGLLAAQIEEHGGLTPPAALGCDQSILPQRLENPAEAW
jgi:hypothetical protein